MTRKRPSPIWGPLLTFALMLGSAAAVVAIADHFEPRHKAPQSTVAAAAPTSAAGQTVVR